MTKQIPLSKGKFAIVDDEDFETATRHKYYATYDGHSWYAVRGTKHTTTYLHIDILGKRPGLIIDHKNGNGLNCRRSNMRWATKKQNMWNSRKHRDSRNRFKGVSRHQNGWRVRICVDRQDIVIGYFKNERAGALAYNKAAKKYFGQFARLNKVR